MRSSARLWTLALVLTLGFGCGKRAGGAPSFGELADGLNASQNTALAASQFWTAHEGRSVTWKGEVVEVKPGRGRAEIYLADRSRPLYRGYNIIVQTSDLAGAGALKRGARVQVQGLLSRYVARSGNPVVITLNNGQLLRD